MEWTGYGLGGLRVVDLSFDVSGLFCAHRLHCLGADVVTRSHRTDAAAVYEGGLRHLALDDPALAGCVATADIVVDDDTPDAHRFLDAIPPTAVRVVITPFGLTGPYAGFAATDLTADAFGGAVSSCGQADRTPVALGGRLVATYVGGMAAAAAVADARVAAMTGTGSVVDIAWVEVLAASMDRRAVQLLTHSYTGWDGERQHDKESPLITGVYSCSDGFVYVSLYGWHIRTVCTLIDDPALHEFIERPALALKQPGNALFKAAVFAWLKARPCHEAADVAQALGWPVIPANSLLEALEDPWLVGSGLIAGANGDARLPTIGISMTPATEVL